MKHDNKIIPLYSTLFLLLKKKKRYKYIGTQILESHMFGYLFIFSVSQLPPLSNGTYSFSKYLTVHLSFGGTI